MKKKLEFMLYLFIAFSIIFGGLPSFAQGSGYYEIPEHGRPQAAFSVCCCEKENQNTQQAFYNCSYIEGGTTCPQNSKPYKEMGAGCPSHLIITKYGK